MVLVGVTLSAFCSPYVVPFDPWFTHLQAGLTEVYNLGEFPCINGLHSLYICRATDLYNDPGLVPLVLYVLLSGRGYQNSNAVFLEAYIVDSVGDTGVLGGADPPSDQSQNRKCQGVYESGASDSRSFAIATVFNDGCIHNQHSRVLVD